MNPERLLQYFEQIADTPDAIPRLRRFILDLAVRGKLVDQDPNDTPVTGQLAHSDRVRQALSKNDHRADSNVQTLLAIEDRWQVPRTWAWRALADLVLFIDYRGQTPKKVKKGVRLITAKNVKKGFVNLFPEEFLSEDDFNAWMTRGIPRTGDILFTTEAPMGNAAIVELTDRFAIAQRIINFRPYGGVNSEFLVLQLLAQPFQFILNKTATGLTAKGIKAAKLKRLPIAVPPLTEQHRIVAKVDELMGLCDKLEAAQRERENQRDRLVTASLSRLNNGSEASDFREHAQFYINHLPSLTTRREHIKQLRQTILDLAIRGKLVSQNPDDEPVSELLKRIQATKNRGITRHHKTIIPLEPDKCPYEVPSSWVWVSFGEIMISRDGERIPVSKDERNLRDKIYDYYGASGVIDKIDKYIFDKPLLLIGEDGANLVNRSTPIAFIARGKYWVNNHAHVLDAASESLLKYIELHINAIDLKPYVTGTAQPKMNQVKMNSIPIALPPESEQQRIVDKVEGLMMICDQLEAHLITMQEDNRRLLEAVLQEALGQAI
ncbi:MAG TPA: restriction endonuclease subunit S [Blastocatellia bacterium]|nr:restriction endonuclease subunit S [Blastocatellia bacterium]